MNDKEMFETDKMEELADSKKPEVPENELASFVQAKFNRAELNKRPDEERALKAYQNYRGLYGHDTKFMDSEKSRVFVKVTKTKVQAAYGQIIEVLFGSGKFPLTVDKTVLSEGVRDEVSFDPQAPATGPKPKDPVSSPFGVANGPALPPGATVHNLNVGSLSTKLEPIMDRLQPGPGLTPTAVTFSPAEIAAKKMEKQIHDQLDESGASKQLRLMAFEMALFGTGILKGPFILNKEYPRWDDKGEYNPVIKIVPSTSQVSFWNFYPDPDGNNMDEVEWTIERHKMSRMEMRQLKNRPAFRPSAIDTAIEAGYNYDRKWWETFMEDGTTDADVDRYEVLEYWGYASREDLEDHNITIPQSLKDKDEINVNIWVCNGQILRLAMNPFKPSRLPYYSVPYELNPYSFFGIGIAENMEDTQLLMNGFMRMAVDNAVLSGNLLIEIDETNLTPDQDLEVYPGKVFKRQGGAPGQAIFGTQFPNVSQQNMMLFDKARQLADESTGFPSFAHGQTGVTGVGRTASGISMLMNAANGNIRTVIKNLDDYLLGPLGKAFFAFNMQFNFDPEIKGDLEVNARGTESLMATEIRSQRLMQFLQVVMNPMLAPFVKLDTVVREIAKSLDLDPEKVTNSLADAAIQAELLKQFSAELPQQGGQAGAPAGVSTESGPGSGGGTIGVGDAPAPGAPGFSANTGEQ